MKILNIYTDGGYKKSSNVGAYGFVIIENGVIIKEYCKKCENAGDNNTMELTAVIKALNWVKSNKFNPNDYRIYIDTDSQDVQLGVTESLHNWKLNNWKTSSNKVIENKKLWIVLDKLLCFEFKSVHIQWIRSHSGNIYNERIDKLCKEMLNKN